MSVAAKLPMTFSLIRTMNMTGIHGSVKTHRCVNIDEEKFQ